MKISLEWLSQYLPGPLDATVFAEALTHGGLPVEVIERVGDDTVIDVEVTSNRGDCLSHLGVARELASLLDRPFNPVRPEVTEAAERAADVAQVRIDDLARCPYYSARVVRGAKVGPSPAWMARRLEAAGVRTINNIVDCTNYVMLEMGQPLHAFDLAHLRGGQIVVRAPSDGETLVTLDGHNRRLSPDMLAIADAERVVALAGVMGGLESEVSPVTTDVLIESARFDPLVVRRMGRTLGLKSEASYRFERGIDPALPPLASLRCAELIAATAGGRVLAGIVEAGVATPAPLRLALRLERLRRILGVDIPPAEVVAALARAHLRPQLAGDRVECEIPSFRGDLRIEVDLVEEVARVLGYHRIPVRDRISIEVSPPQPHRVAEGKIRAALVSAGYFEAVTFSFATDGLAERFAPAGARLCQADPGTRKADGKLRPSILPGLIEAVRRNESVGVANARLFELGSTFWHAADGSIDERRRVALVAADDYRAVRGAVESLLMTLDATRDVHVKPAEAEGFAPGSTGRVCWSGGEIGTIGVIAPAVAEQLGLRATVVAAELELPPLIAGTQHVPQLQPLPKFPAVRRDLSLIVSEATRFEAIRALVADERLPALESLEYVTTYRGKPLVKGTKSVTVTLVFRSPGGTLTSDEVDTAVARVVKSCITKLGATLRT